MDAYAAPNLHNHLGFCYVATAVRAIRIVPSPRSRCQVFYHGGMATIRIHTLHTGKVCVSPDLPFGGEDCPPWRAAGIFTSVKNRLWLPVSVYLSEHEKGLVLVDTGWSRSMSPDGVLDKRAQIKSLGSRLLQRVNQGVVGKGQTAREQLALLGHAPEDIDYVLLTHLDCDHANGLPDLAGAKRVLVSNDELASVNVNRMARVRYQSKWWDGSSIEGFDWNGEEGPHGKSFDLFGDGSVVLIGIPGHSDGLFAVKITGDDGRFVLLTSDGAYGRKSWEQMVLSGVANDRAAQRTSLEWIAEQARDPLCIEVLANHDEEIEPHITELEGIRDVSDWEEAPPAAEEDEFSQFKHMAGKVAVAMALASTLAGATITADQVHLPAPVPIVQTIDLGAGSGGVDAPDTVADEQKSAQSSIWEKIVNILKYALIVLLFVAAVFLGVTKGCSACVGPAAVPPAGNDQSQHTDYSVLTAAGDTLSSIDLQAIAEA